MNKFIGQFLKIANEVVKQAVPGVAMAESAIVAIKSGADKKAAVVELIKSSLMATEDISDKDLVNDPMFAEGVDEVNDGLVKILKAIQLREKV